MDFVQDPLAQNSVSYTSHIVAAKRAIEQERPDRLFDDPFAALLAATEIPVLLERWQRTGKDMNYLKAVRTRFVAVRTRIFDDFVLAANRKASQVVILGAGLDARAYRLVWTSNTHLYEVDRPEVLQHKESVLRGVSAQCQRQSIAADLSEDWNITLLKQGYCPNQPSIWLLEGVLMYLSEVEVHRLLQIISALTASGSYLAADLVSVKSIEIGLKNEGRVRQHWRFGTDCPEALLSAYGWNATVLQPGDEGANFGRYNELMPPRSIPNQRRVFFATAVKVD